MPFVPGVGILIEQEPLAEAELAEQIAEVAERHASAIAEAREYLASTGMSPWTLAETNLTPKRAWFSDEYGFVYPEHPDAQLVLVVDIPMPDLPPEPDPVEVVE